MKRPGERPTADQIAFLRAAGEAGACAFWADSVAVVARVLNAVQGGQRVEVDEHGDQVLTDDPREEL